MFKKIVSNLSFSPALVGQLGPFSKTLHKETTTRRLSLVFTSLSIIVVALTILQPPTTDGKSTNNSISALYDNKSQDSGLKKTVNAINASQGYIDASSAIAQPDDQINYTITAQNTNSSSMTVKIQESLSDILEYSTLVDNGGGIIDNTTKTLYWPDITLDENSSQTRTFVTRILNPIPVTAQSKNNALSYDCAMTNVFGNSIKIKVNCPAIKTIERVTSNLPKSSQLDNIVFACILLLTTAYFYARAHLLEKELRLIRKDAIAGTI